MRPSVYSIVALRIAQVYYKASRCAYFGIGRRRNRVVSLTSDVTGQIVPNIFQLSSGETSLLNLFLSISGILIYAALPSLNSAEIRGIVVVDEIDLHLHVVHQREILPELIRMFPNVQFVVTTHSPLFILGMQEVFKGEDGFSLYRLPQGHPISPEEFGEFANAYRKSLTETVRFASDMRAAIEAAQFANCFRRGIDGQENTLTLRPHSCLDKEIIDQSSRPQGWKWCP